MSRRELEWELLGARPGPRLPLFAPRFDERRHPVDGAVLSRLVLASVDWINVVAIDAGGLLVMVEQYRFGTGRLTVEPPGGMVDPGETALEAARRELLEETGYGGGVWSYLGAVEPNPAVHDHWCHHWLARDVRPVAAQRTGQGEAIAVRLMHADEIAPAIAAGRLRHALALSALARSHDVFSRYKPATT